MAEKDTECFEALSMNRIFGNFLKLLSVRHFDKLSAGSEPSEGLQSSFFATSLEYRDIVTFPPAKPFLWPPAPLACRRLL
jgi:hypothetical protein